MKTDKNQYYEAASVVLLTGAGFTKSFGGFLSREMWQQIFNQPEVQAQPDLRSILRGNFDYEWVYDHVLFPKPGGSTYSDDDRKVLTSAVRKAYERMHRTVCSDEIQKWSEATGVCREVIGLLSGSGNKRGFVFTLNQDLFLECFYSNGQTGRQIQLPGIRPRARWFNGQLGSRLQTEDIVDLAENQQIDELKQAYWGKTYGSFHYVKLHGSYGWQLHGTEVMVLGTAKSELIKRISLLDWYFQIFKEVLMRPRQKLLIIGYGFGDDHINHLLLEAVARFQARFFVVSPQKPHEFKDILENVRTPPLPIDGVLYEVGHSLYTVGLAGYCEGQITDLYRPNPDRLTSKGEDFLQDVGLLK